MANTIVGRIARIGQTINVSRDREFLKRELVLDCSRYDEFSGEKKENYAVLSFTQKNCSKLDGFAHGELVDVSFFLNGRKYEKDGQTKYITDIIGYDISRREGHGTQSPQSPQAAAPQAPQHAPQPVATGGEEQERDDSQLPF